MIEFKLIYTLAASFSFFKDNLALNIILIVSFILLILLSAFFSGTEEAYSNSNPTRLKVYLEEEKRGAKRAVKLAEAFDHVQVIIWSMNIIVDLILIVIGYYFFINIFSNLVLASSLFIIFMAFILILFTTFIPRHRAKHNPEMIALRNSGIIYIFYKVLYPLSYLILKLKKVFIKKDKSSTIPKVTEEELESIIDTMETEGVIDEEDAELIQSAIDLNEKTVDDIMTPRVDIIAIDISSTTDEVLDMYFNHQFSRVPVYKVDKDNIVGILSEKDFFTAVIKNEPIQLGKLITKPLFVSESTKVYDLIKEFQKIKKHFAVVVDEYGGTSGIVTMEDALEELVGEIYDEYDEEELTEIEKIGENSYRVSPDMETEDLFEYLGIEELPNTQYNLLGGFVYSLMGGLPKEGMQVLYETTTEEGIVYNLIFTVAVVKNKRIRLLKLEVEKTNKKEENVIEE